MALAVDLDGQGCAQPEAFDAAWLADLVLEVGGSEDDARLEAEGEPGGGGGKAPFAGDDRAEARRPGVALAGHAVDGGGFEHAHRRKRGRGAEGEAPAGVGPDAVVAGDACLEPA